MNFKETYKSANDCLHADRKIIQELFSDNTHKVFPIRRYAALCSVAAVLILVFIGFSHFDGTDKNSDFMVAEQRENMQTKTPDDKSAAEPAEPPTEEKIAKAAPKHNTFAADYYEKAPETTQKNNTVENEAANVTPALDDSAEMCDSQKTRISASGGSGGASFNSNISTKYLSIDEYEAYLGIDFETYSPVLPDDMSFQIPEIAFSVDRASGDITDDTVSFVATGALRPSAIVNVTVSSHIAHSYHYTEGASINTNGTDVVIFEENGVLSAQFTIDGHHVVVSAVDVSREELDAFLNSIL